MECIYILHDVACLSWRHLEMTLQQAVYSDIVLFFVSPNHHRTCVIHQDPRFVTVKLLVNLKVCAQSGYYPSIEAVVLKKRSHSLHTVRFA